MEDKRDCVVQIRMYASEKEVVEGLAKSAGLSLSDFGRLRMLAEVPPPLPVIDVTSEKAAIADAPMAPVGVGGRKPWTGPNGEPWPKEGDYDGSEEMPVGKMGVTMSPYDRRKMQLIAQARIKRRRAPESKE